MVPGNNGGSRRTLSRQHIIKLPTELRCADMSKEANMRIGFKSCYCCDNFCMDRGLFLPPGIVQDAASQKKYGCRQKERIKVSVKYSAHERSKSTKNQNQTTAPSSKPSNVTFPSFVPPNVKRKLSLWRQHEESKEILEIKKETDKKNENKKNRM